MSKSNTDAVEPSTGTSLVLGASGDTISIPAGATIANSGTATGFGGDNTPSFQARKTTSQTSLTSDTFYKISFETEDWDTDSAYDHSTNYRFTVPAGEGGKYQLYSQFYVMSTGQGNLQQSKVYFYLNGSASNYANISDWRDGSHGTFTMNFWVSAIMSLSAGDYVEVYATTNTATGTFEIDNNRGYFSGYKLIGV